MEIRPLRSSDLDFVEALSRDVFSQYGPYETWIPEWAAFPGVLTFVGETENRLDGFYMLAFYRDALVDTEPSYVADLLAIAVDPVRQRRGLGRTLLGHAGAVAERLGATGLVLSVADTNVAAQALFTKNGFRLLEGDHGSYRGGQRTLKMFLPLPKTSDGHRRESS